MSATSNETIQKVSAAIGDRARWLALLLRSFERVLPREKAVRCCREAIFAFGEIKARADSKPFGPSEWVNRHLEKGSAAVFDSLVHPGRETAVQIMRRCPLVEAWREMGCSDEEVALLCDIAMEGDRGRARAHGLSVSLPERIGRGDGHCRLEIHAGPGSALQGPGGA